ncbi:YWTD domain-containing protein [Aspergillus keveii]|uniref:YWTD domain-containing protein n=1 Tax=Aspergillus keveii TaxID=714993 RepID=A0ABR4GN62_9EURO
MFLLKLMFAELLLQALSLPPLTCGRILSVSTDGTSPHTVLDNLCTAPDGIVVDQEAGYIYYSQMGSGVFLSGNGTIERTNLDGSERTVLIGGGMTTTPKQLILAEVDGVKKLYWGDREGMKVMRSNIDGSGVEVVIDTSTSAGSAESKLVVGVAIDTINDWFYWTQKGSSVIRNGSLHRARLIPPPGSTPSSRTDAQILLSGLPEPIDLHLRPSTNTLYWTDRGNLGQGSVNSLALGTGQTVTATPTVLVSRVGEAIGITIDEATETLFFSNLGGEVYAYDLVQRTNRRIARGLGLLTGVDLA